MEPVFKKKITKDDFVAFLPHACDERLSWVDDASKTIKIDASCHSLLLSEKSYLPNFDVLPGAECFENVFT